MATSSERDPLEIMLENLSSEQRAAVDKIADEKNISPIQALLAKIEQENDENSADKKHNHAP